MAFVVSLALPHRQSSKSFCRVITACATTAKELSVPLPETSLPLSLQDTTIYHILPSALPYLPRASHTNDNDTLILALSFQTPWLRTRYIRSKEFIVEARSGTRVFRGLHGTPAPARPSTPKRAPSGITPVRKWLVAYGAGLPYKISPRDLVTFGRTALGDVLSGDDVLADERGTELAHSVRCGKVDWLLTRVRNPAGRVVRSFVVEAGTPTRRVLTVNGFEGQEIAVCGGYVIVVGWKVDAVGGVRGLVRGLFGGSGSSPSVEVANGSEVIVMDRSGRIVARGRVDGVLSNISATEKDGGVSITAKRVLGKILSLTTLEDIRSGDTFIDGGDIETSVIRFGTSAGAIGELHEPCKADVDVMDMAKLYNSEQGQSTVFIGCNRVSKRIGLWALDGACWEAEEGYRLSGAVFSPDHTHITALLTNFERPAKILFFDSADIAGGPVGEVVLEGLGALNTSIGAVWTDWDFGWSKENAKIAKSAYELFAEKEWNDIESGFSSLGV